MSTPPLPFRYDGEALIPLKPGLTDRHYVVGEVYQIIVEEQRSEASHRHEFAWLRDAWLNLPEQYADLFPSVEHLRKRALIEAGYYTEQIVDAGSAAAALRVASAFRSREEFSLVLVRGRHVILRTAKSQSRRAMKAAEFQESKTAILEVISNMIGVEPGALLQNAGKAA